MICTKNNINKFVYSVTLVPSCLFDPGLCGNAFNTVNISIHCLRFYTVQVWLLCNLLLRIKYATDCTFLEMFFLFSFSDDAFVVVYPFCHFLYL